jgi:TolA-binding protein
MIRKALLIMMASFFILALFFACGDQKEAEKSDTKVTYEDVKKESKEAMETAKEYTQEKKEEYLMQMRAKLDEFNKEIQELQSKAASNAIGLKEASKEELNQSMKELAEKKKAAAEKIDELKNASGDAWDDIKTGADSAMDELSKALERARSDFKS